ncbi:hypothetical protein ENSA5_42730 [Enhygromyxa salina]|uniref:Uncharacterized protein n=1 Tax=Enhygromyxa salina TaxID=215803 RepID=A0A2S9XKG8_9BACT|nr:hypothetical protein [Enhygromyxa salina]PRP93374.1 hypothetical protein ENSA5_42730 [Enhygromyxa salina]
MADIRQDYPNGTKITVDGETWTVVGHYGGIQSPQSPPDFTNRRAGVIAAPEGGGDPKIFRREQIGQ